MALITNYHGTLETQQDKKQDFAIQGKLKNGKIWFAIFDGHGRDIVIDAIRGLDYNEIMEMPNPAHEIQKKISSIPDTFKSGSTMSIVIISDHEIKCYWKGDSTIKIYKNDEEIVACANHDSTNENEKRRITPFDITIVDDWRPVILSPTSITMVQSPYYRLSYNEILNTWDQTNMTNSLGHNDRLGTFIEEKTIPLTPNEEFTVLIASDGFWDIVAPEDTHIQKMTDCHELTEFAKSRWAQDWTYEYPGHPSQTTKFGPADDMAIAMWKGRFVSLD